jgi:Glycosyltransferase sugar-binding region containing DXD motif
VIKKIHYCWFGSAKPPAVLANVAEWKRLNPDFEFCEWNDQNVAVSECVSDCEFGRRALEHHRWGYLVDIIRLHKLIAEGGCYLDADVELIRPLSVLAAETDCLVMGYIYDCALGTAVIYSPPRHPILEAVLREYNHIRPDCWPVNNSVFTDYFINHLSGFLLNGRRWRSEEHKISLYPKEFFEQPAFVRNRGLAIHHCSGSWMPGRSGNAFTTRGRDSSHRIKWLKRKLRTFYSVLRSEYRLVYLKALRGVACPMHSEWRTEPLPKVGP